MPEQKVKVFSYSETSRADKEQNEDSHYCFFDEDKNIVLLLVCDGLGGAPGGQTASQTIRNAFIQYFDESFLIKLKSESKDTILTTLNMRLTSILTSARHELKKAYKEENQARQEQGKVLLPEKHKRGGFASTFSCAIIIDDTLYYSWVGDSRVYLLRNGRLKPLSYDHSTGVFAENFNELDLVLSGKVMSKCVSPFADDEFVDIDESEIFTEKLEENDIIFCASDGIFDYLLPWVLEMVFVKTLAFGYQPEEYIKKIYYQIRPVFQDDTTIAIMFKGSPKPYGTNFPYIDDAFFYLNSFELNNMIENEFNSLPMDWDQIKPDEHYKKYLSRQSWDKILEQSKRLTEKQDITDKVYCKTCKSVYNGENAGEKCKNENCNGELLQTPFIEIFLKHNSNQINPFEIVTIELELNPQTNLYTLNIENENQNKIMDLFHEQVKIMQDKNEWKINSENFEIFTFYPQVFTKNTLKLVEIKKIMIGDDIYDFIFPDEKSGNTIIINNNEYTFENNKLFIYGSGEGKVTKTEKGQVIEYVKLTGNYTDNNSGVFYKTQENEIIFQDAKWDNGLFISSGKNEISFNQYPKNVMIKIKNICFAFRGKAENLKVKTN